jgi:hypothetical protein
MQEVDMAAAVQVRQTVGVALLVLFAFEVGQHFVYGIVL